MKKTYSRKIVKSAVFWCCSFVCICFTIHMYIPYVAAAELVDRIVAQVNEDIITRLDLENALRPYLEKIKASGNPPEKEQQMMFKAKEDVLNELINEKLTDQEVKEEGISIKEKDIDEYCRNVLKRRKIIAML